MKITELLKMMNESDVYRSDLHEFRIYGDGSGCIIECDVDNEKSVISWGAGEEEKMQEELTKIYSSLKQNNVKFEL